MQDLFKTSGALYQLFLIFEIKKKNIEINNAEVWSEGSIFHLLFGRLDCSRAHSVGPVDCENVGQDWSIYQNLRGLCTKADEFISYLIDADYNIICLFETWLCRDYPCRGRKLGGGGLIAAEVFFVSHRRFHLESYPECVWVEIRASDGCNYLIEIRLYLWRIFRQSVSEWILVSVEYNDMAIFIYRV